MNEVSAEYKAQYVHAFGYDYGAVASYALAWDCSLGDAISKLYDKLKGESQ